MRGSLVWLAWLGGVLVLSACETGGDSLDGDVLTDAATLDATLPRDQATSDVGPDADLADASADAAPPDASRPDGGSSDAGSPIGVACAVQGVAGTCQLVSSCTQVTTPGYCPGPADVRCCHPAIPPSDAGMPVDQGTFTCDPDVHPTPNAGLEEAPGAGGCPPGMLSTGTFCMDRYEAFVRIDRGTGAAPEDWSPYHHPPTLGAGQTLVAFSVAGAIPQGQISGIQAANACAGAGKRLCTDAEWLTACRGPSSHVYPYGNTRQPGVCNDARAVHPAVEYFGTGASWIWSMLGNPCIAQIPNALEPTGSHPGCVTSGGAFDMMGNLHEWTSAAAGTFRGGFFADTAINGNGCLYATTAHDTQHWDYSTGFRCCADL